MISREVHPGRPGRVRPAGRRPAVPGRDTVPQLDPRSSRPVRQVRPPDAAARLRAWRARPVLSRQPPRGLPPVAPATWGTAVAPYCVGPGKMLKARHDGRLGTAGAGQRRPPADAHPGGGPRAGRDHLLDHLLDPGRAGADPSAGRAAAVGAGAGQRPAAERDAGGCATARTWTSRRRGAGRARPSAESSDEIDQVQEAFNIVQRTAIEAAVDEANAAPRGSATCSATWPGAARCCCTASCGCWTGWSAGPASPRSWRTCSASTTSPPGCAATPRA